MPQNDLSPTTYDQYFEGGGEMGSLIRAFDWSETALGSPDGWPDSLLTTISIMLDSRFPMFLWWGPELIQFYNDAYRPSLGNEGKHPKALGQRGEECWPEIWPVIKPLIDQVMAGGKAVWSEDQLIPIFRNDKLEDVYWTFSYSKVKDKSGNITGVLVICNETTHQIQALKALKEVQKELAFTRTQAEHQRDRLERFFMQAPIGVCILDGPDLIFELINPSYQQLFPGRSLLGKPLLDAVPEIKGQPIWDILQNVYCKEETFEGNELLIPLARHNNGPIEDRYFNFIYQPRNNANGLVDGIMVCAFEVTDMIVARKKLEKAEDTLKLALMAAELGTFDMDLEKGTMEWDDRCRILFGISHQEKVTYDKDFILNVHPEDREAVFKVIENVFVKSFSNGDYDEEFRTVGLEDNKVRWVRAKGQVYFNERDKPLRFIGSVLDITELKQNEIRKNDFIAMVSHELKTPLTLLKAYVQMVNVRAKKNEDSFTANALQKVNTQVNKMTDMINGFLNVSRLEAGKIPMNKKEFTLNDLITATVEDIVLTVKSHTITFEHSPPLNVSADYDKIGQVINNLISNAVKYSPKGRMIGVTCYKADGMALVTITDEGMGIKPNDIEKLFERFYRIDSQHTKAISGFGIGLYLCEEIIEQHDGKIWVESEIGKGSTFYFSLPLTIN